MILMSLTHEDGWLSDEGFMGNLYVCVATDDVFHLLIFSHLTDSISVFSIASVL